MHPDQFNELCARTFNTCRELLAVKGGEYAADADKLANFKRGAELTGVKPLTVLMIYLAKHYDAVSTYVRDKEAGRDRPRSEAIAGRWDDLINYCVLAKALIEEEGE
jgi:hypothetical protein